MKQGLRLFANRWSPCFFFWKAFAKNALLFKTNKTIPSRKVFQIHPSYFFIGHNCCSLQVCIFAEFNQMTNYLIY
jgi:hypothetical protein